MDTFIKLFSEHGFSTAVAIAAVLSVGWMFYAVMRIIHSYFRTDGVVTKWFLASTASSDKIASAVAALPATLGGLEKRTEEHHDKVNANFDKLIEVTEQGHKATLSWLSQAADPTSVFSTVRTNDSLASAIEAAAAMVERSMTEQPADRKLIEAASHLERALHRLQGRNNG